VKNLTGGGKRGVGWETTTKGGEGQKAVLGIRLIISNNGFLQEWGKKDGGDSR